MMMSITVADHVHELAVAGMVTVVSQDCGAAKMYMLSMQCTSLSVLFNVNMSRESCRS